METEANLRAFKSQRDLHYGGGLVAGARVLELLGDAVTALPLERDGAERLLARYEEVEFHRPVPAGDTVDVTARAGSAGGLSRLARFSASVRREPVCTALAVVVARQYGADTAQPAARVGEDA